MAQLLFTAKLGKVRGAGSSILVIGGEAILTASTAKDKKDYSDMFTLLISYGSGKRGWEIERRARWAFVYRGHEKVHSRHFWGMIGYPPSSLLFLTRLFLCVLVPAQFLIFRPFGLTLVNTAMLGGSVTVLAGNAILSGVYFVHLSAFDNWIGVGMFVAVYGGTVTMAGGGIALGSGAQNWLGAGKFVFVGTCTHTLEQNQWEKGFRRGVFDRKSFHPSTVTVELLIWT